MSPRNLGALSLLVISLSVNPGALQGQDALYFTAVQDARQPILNLIAAETVRIDVAAWWFTDRVVSDAIVRRHQAGVTVRFIGDASAYRDAHTRAQIDYLASQGVPIRLRSPAGIDAIVHWKCGIFAGQRKVAFGSANWTVYSLRPYSSTNYDDDTMQVTADSDLVPAFRMKFDQMWVDTAAFIDFANITTGGRVRLEPDAVLPASMIWSQGTNYNTRLIAVIDAEQQFVDLVAYRLGAASVTDALVRRVQAGVRVRLVIDPVQYRNTKVRQASANLDRLWALSVPIRQRVHQGMTHMKTIVTSTIATNGSSNLTDSWQRDHNYFIDKAIRPTVHEQLRSRVAAMFADTVGFGSFRPQAPGSATLLAPANGATNVALAPALDWSDAAWATNYDVMLGTSESNLTTVGGRIAESRLALAARLQPGTEYYWRVRARTNATPRDATLATTTGTWSFTTGPAGDSVTPGIDVVLRAASIPSSQVHGDWSPVADDSAAGKVRLANPDRGVPKLLTASGSPASYFDVAFTADAGRPYHLWLRLRAQNDTYTNDSVFVQFSGSVTSTGAPTTRIGTSDAAVVSLENSNGAGMQGWGWNDNGWASVGPHIYFGSTGTQRIRIQVREDGVSIDQIVISPSTYLVAAPGALKNDGTILP